MYEIVKPLAAHQELVVYYLPERPERPEELFFVRMRSTLYRRTMDSILEGKEIYFCIKIRKISTSRSIATQMQVL